MKTRRIFRCFCYSTDSKDLAFQEQETLGPLIETDQLLLTVRRKT